MKSEFESRLRALEARRFTGVPRPAAVIIAGPAGFTTEQQQQRAAALQEGRLAVVIEFKDASRTASSR